MTPIQFHSIEEALAMPRSAHFRIAHDQGRFRAGDEQSFYSRIAPDPHLTFDVSNNAVLVNVGYDGSLKYVTVFRGDYRADPGKRWAGVWVYRDFTKYGPYSFALRLGDTEVEPAHSELPYTSSLLGNVFPITEFVCDGLSVTVLTYTPISRDGAVRPRGVVYGAFVRNDSDVQRSGSVVLPHTADDRNVASEPGEAGLRAFRSLPVRLLGREDTPADVPFELEPGESIWLPVLIHAYGEPVYEQVNDIGSVSWLSSTWSYFRSMTGTLRMPGDPFTAEFFERAVHQCIGCIGMDASGRVNGSNWGTYPPTTQVWMKDLYYSLLPLGMLEPDMFRRGMLWFSDYSVRPPGADYEGGVTHSLSNALSPVMMAGLYYACTGDRHFFAERRELVERLAFILEEVLRSRPDTNVWLFSSRFISDGLSYSDYHVGSNICAWYAFSSFARVLREAYGHKARADEYERIAEWIREAIDDKGTADGPFGRQYVEGVNRDGSVPWMGHEGEESDTTLMPFYGYLSYDDPVYKNYTRFAMTEHNPAYSPVTRGIKWGSTLDPLPVQATYPGYITGFANVVDRESMVGVDGWFTRIRQLTDVDGSIWWWPYASTTPKYGVPARFNITGKSGWASGLFVCLFVTQILGLSYDAPRRKLQFRPFSPSSNFTWHGFRLGHGRFSVGLTREPKRTEVRVTNENDHSVTVDLELAVEDDGPTRILANGREYGGTVTRGRFLGAATLKLTETLSPAEERVYTVGENG
jgi:hypothetical protein